MTLLLLFAGGLSWAADVKVTNSDGDPLIVYVNGKERGKTPTTQIGRASCRERV